jgi:hypothetical protein
MKGPFCVPAERGEFAKKRRTTTMQRSQRISSLLTGISARRLTAGGITTCPESL